MRQTVGILGTPVDVLDMDAVLVCLDEFIAEGRFHQVATANTDFLVNALEDAELRCILRNAELVVPDGMPLIWASRLMGSPLPERVTGADLVPKLAAVAAVKGYRIFMLGARPEVAQQARERLTADNPGLQIVGCFSPPVAPLTEMDHAGLLAQIRIARPDILLVAFGNPKQEKWIHMNRLGLAGVPVCIGVGGTFDFIAGHIARAPQWMQRFGLEWVYRLKQEPRRLYARYARDLGLFGGHIWRQLGAMRRQRFNGSLTIKSECSGHCAVISLCGDIDRRSVSQVWAAVSQALEAGADIILDLERVSAIDGIGLGLLINMPAYAAEFRRETYLASMPPRMNRILQESQLLDGHFIVTPTVADALALRRPALAPDVVVNGEMLQDSYRQLDTEPVTAHVGP